MRQAAPNPLLQQAVALHQAGRLDEAVKLYEKIVRQDSRAAGALNLLGLARFQLGQLPQAADALRRVIKLAPDLPNIDYNLGRVFQAQERWEDALRHYQKAVANAPADAEALGNLGSVLTALGRLSDSIPVYQRALAMKPNYVEGWFNLANAYGGLERYEEAVEAYKKVLALDPNHADAYGALGLALNGLDRASEAIEYCRRAVALNPGKVNAHINVGLTLEHIGDDVEAEKSYDRALAIDPQAEIALWNKSLLFLSRGEYSKGWPLFPHRWGGKIVEKERNYPFPTWQGETTDGEMLVWAEQGLGDQILLAGMISDARARAGSLVFEVEPRLVPLMARSFPDITVIPRAGDISSRNIALQATVGELGLHLRPNPEAFAATAGGYLVPDAKRAAELRTRLTADGKRVIGVSWSSVNKRIGRAKSAQLLDLAPILGIPNCRFIDLQYGDTQADRDLLKRETGIELETVPDVDNTNDIDGLAALIAACDAVVTISNTTAHLAAALGRPTFILLAQGSGLLWYWMRRGDRTPVYSNAHLSRRQPGNSWKGLAQTMAPEIENFLKTAAG